MSYSVLLSSLDTLRREAPKRFKTYYPLKSDLEKVNQAHAKAFVHLFLKVRFGVLDFSGVYHAGKEEGGFVITVHADGISGNARVIIAKTAASPKGQIDIENGKNRMSWMGEVPAQKWMHFYTKLLAKFVNTSDLKIHVKIDVASDDGISEQKINEAKQALRELGLDDDVES